MRPWCDVMTGRLDTYSKWLENGKTWLFLEKELNRLLPDVNRSAPAAYEACLGALREINEQGKWPGTTIGRRLVILDSNKR